MEKPQRLSHDAIEKFRSIYGEEFGEDISDDEAEVMGLRLLKLLKLLVKPKTTPIPE